MFMWTLDMFEKSSLGRRSLQLSCVKIVDDVDHWDTEFILLFLQCDVLKMWLIAKCVKICVKLIHIIDEMQKRVTRNDCFNLINCDCFIYGTNLFWNDFALLLWLTWNVSGSVAWIYAFYWKTLWDVIQMTFMIAPYFLYSGTAKFLSFFYKNKFLFYKYNLLHLCVSQLCLTFLLLPFRCFLQYRCFKSFADTIHNGISYIGLVSK